MYNYPTNLCNFRIPLHLQAEIFDICKYRNISRTRLILDFLEQTAKQWKPVLEEHQRAASVKAAATHDDALSILSSDDREMTNAW